MSSAPPAAWTTRAATSTQTSGAAAQAAEARPKTIIPVRNAARRPIRSAARPAGTSSAANTIAYALSTQDRSARPAPPKLRPMDGSATLTMNRSRFTTAMPAVTMANTAPNRAAGRVAACPAAPGRGCLPLAVAPLAAAGPGNSPASGPGPPSATLSLTRTPRSQARVFRSV